MTPSQAQGLPGASAVPSAGAPAGVSVAAPAVAPPSALPAAPALSAALPGATRPLDARLLDAREALRKKDRARLAAARDELVAARHPLAMWADYWELGLRLGEVGQNELEAFYARWPGTYVEDRLRNDWLLELGRRHDWGHFNSELPRFRLADDKEVQCYALLTRHLAGEDVRAAVRSAWLAQREPGDGCALMASTLREARRLATTDVWLKARLSAESGRNKLAREALALLGDNLSDKPALDKLMAELWDQPQRYLAKRADATSRPGAELVVLALVRLATSDPAAAAAQLDERWAATLAPDTLAWTWAAIAKQAAWKLQPEADGWFQRALAVPYARDVEWSDETLAWRARAALRATDAARWQRVLAAIDALSPALQTDATWAYWKARALTALAPPGVDGDGQRLGAALLLERVAPQLNFYGKLAAEALDRPQTLPPRPLPLSVAERQAAEANPALSRALLLIGLGLRSEGVREWNFSVIDLGERALLAAAQRACDREVWDRCINTSERTRGEIDMAQRFPTPHRDEVLAVAGELGLEPAFIYGLIRQESRFVTDARSSVGAAGLMQVMPATASWTARKLGLPYAPEQIADRSMNLRLGAGYLKLVLDDQAGSQALAAAAYNAGPNRLRRWREGPPLEVAAWAENIPFNETRDYVKKVLSNASYYAALLAERPADRAADRAERSANAAGAAGAAAPAGLA
ncbi:MAG: lytic transglycosylase domain-containing protein, partial [Leptothrix sp. (in: b-proteobacteria)]